MNIQRSDWNWFFIAIGCWAVLISLSAQQRLNELPVRCPVLGFASFELKVETADTIVCVKRRPAPGLHKAPRLKPRFEVKQSTVAQQ